MQKNYDAAFCGSLPLNFINHVQPYGQLVVLQKSDLQIVQVSQNVEELLGIPIEDILGKPFSSFIAGDGYAKLQELSNAPVSDKLPLSFSFNGSSAQHLGIVHVKEDIILIELEKIEAYVNNSFLAVYQRLKHAMAAINSAGTIDDVCTVAAAEFKSISGFDKVMIYRFDEQWNGTVIAELKEEGMDTYLGLRFPASDVPRQARELYYRNPYRQIPDRGYTPVKLLPVINPVTESFTDLSDCNLRSVANVHLEYLKNMSVTASMSIRIIKDNKLWGLISCHHKSSKFLNYEVCSVLELLSGVISQKISNLATGAELRYTGYLKSIESKLIEQIYNSGSFINGLVDHDNSISNILHTDNFIIINDKKYISRGAVPAEPIVRNIVMWLQGMDINNVFHTTNLSEVYEAGTQVSGVASGMIVLPVNPGKGNYIIGFRPEVVHVVDWGGNPNEAIHFEENRKNYHPRNSFGVWQETVKNTSLPWSKEEIAVAESFRNVLVGFSLKKLSAIS